MTPSAWRATGRWWRLAQKELRETLRDRRTIVTLFAMPLIVYPILSLVFKTFLFASLGNSSGDGLIRYRYLILLDEELDEQREADVKGLLQAIEQSTGDRESPTVQTTGSDTSPSSAAGENGPDLANLANPSNRSSGRNLARFSDQGWRIDERQNWEPDQALAEGVCDVVMVLQKTRQRPPWRWQVTLYASDEDPVSSAARSYLKKRLTEFNLNVLQKTLEFHRHDPQLAVSATDVEVQLPGRKPQFTAMIPLILVLMTITGAVYPAIDLTAGERERGTLETLIAAPLPRVRVLLAKLLAVVTVAVLTATLNVVGMMSTIWAFQLEPVLLGDNGLTLGMAVKVFGLLALFATFFSAILLVVTSFARSFKEAQAYLIPIILLSLGPGLLALSPQLKLEGPWAVCPLVNLLLLARDVLENQVSLFPAAVAVFSTCVYALLAIAVAASIFGSDSILYGGTSSWQELWRSPLQVSDVASVNVASFCLFVLFPLNFVAISALGRMATSEFSTVPLQLLAMSLFTFLAFGLFPTLVAGRQRIRLSSGFGWLSTRSLFFAIAVLWGLTFWPLVMALINVWYEMLSWWGDPEAAKAFHDRLSEFSEAQATKFREAPPWVIAIALSLVPAACEEWFFRGLFQRALVRAWRPAGGIVVSAVAFGIFHTLSGSVVSFDRLLPTTLMGLVLGVLAYRSNSVLPGMVLHSLHNASIAFIAYYLPQLNQLSWFPRDAESIPWTWTLASLVAVVLGGIILARAPQELETEPFRGDGPAQS